MEKLTVTYLIGWEEITGVCPTSWASHISSSCLQPFSNDYFSTMQVLYITYQQLKDARSVDISHMRSTAPHITTPLPWYHSTTFGTILPSGLSFHFKKVDSVRKLQCSKVWVTIAHGRGHETVAKFPNFVRNKSQKRQSLKEIVNQFLN